MRHGSYQSTKESLYSSEGGVRDGSERRYILLKMSFKTIFEGRLFKGKWAWRPGVGGEGKEAPRLEKRARAKGGVGKRKGKPGVAEEEWEGREQGEMGL